VDTAAGGFREALLEPMSGFTEGPEDSASERENEGLRDGGPNLYTS